MKRLHSMVGTRLKKNAKHLAAPAVGVAMMAPEVAPEVGKAVHDMRGKTCGGEDAWRRIEGCLPTGARLKGDDLDCSQTPGVETSGFCDCADAIPRHFGCGVVKRPCRDVCAQPPPPSSLPGAFASPPPSDATSDAGSDAGPPWMKYAPVAAVAVALALLALWIGHTSPPTDRQLLRRRVRQEQREIAFERSLSSR